MLAIVKTPHIEISAKVIPESLLLYLKAAFGKVVVEEDEDSSVSFRDSKWFKSVESKSTPAESILLCREIYGFTQAKLAESVGVPVQNISALENGKRPVSKQMAKKLGKAFGVSPDTFYFYA